MRRAGIVIIAMLAALAGCGTPAPASGVVTERIFHPAFYWTQMICSGYDTKGNCTMYVPILHYQPDSYELCLVADDDPKHRGCRDATIDEYERYQVGQHYPDSH